MDLREKVKLALERSLQPDQLLLDDRDGISGYVVSSRFRDVDFIDRQRLIYDVLRNATEQLQPEELRRVIAIAALTPEEYAGHDSLN